MLYTIIFIWVFFFFFFFTGEIKESPQCGRHRTIFEGCMDFRLALAFVQNTSRMSLGQSAPSVVDVFCVVFLSAYMFVLRKDESLGKYSCMHLPLHK